MNALLSLRPRHTVIELKLAKRHSRRKSKCDQGKKRQCKYDQFISCKTDSHLSFRLSHFKILAPVTRATCVPTPRNAGIGLITSQTGRMDVAVAETVGRLLTANTGTSDTWANAVFSMVRSLSDSVFDWEVEVRRGLTALWLASQLMDLNRSVKLCTCT